MPSRSNAGRAARHGPRPILRRAGERAIRAELARLRRELDVDLACRLREARTFGGAAENDDYLQIQEERAVLEARIAQLSILLRSADVADDAPGDGKAVIGSIVRVESLETGEVAEHRLVGAHEGPKAGAVSAGAPLGTALLGRREGEVTAVDLPSGHRRTLRILAVAAG